MPNTKDWVPGDKIQALVYGKSGVGKTFGALSFPRPVVMDFDKGIATARNPVFVEKYGIRDIEYEQFSEKKIAKSGVPLDHNAFDDACRYFDKWMETPDEFDTWIVDSGTSLSQTAMNKAIILLGGPQFRGLSKTHEHAKKTGLVHPRLQDYGSERSMVEQFIQMVKDSDKNFLFLCHEKELYVDDAVVGTVPLLTGKSVEAVQLMFDEVWNLRVTGALKTKARKLMTDTNGIIAAKSRYGIPTDQPFDYDTIHSALEEIRHTQKEMA